VCQDFWNLVLFGTATVLQACGGLSTSSSSGPVTSTVAYHQFGPPPYPEEMWWTAVKQRVEAANPNIKVKLEPIIASEGDYYTKLDLMIRSTSTAPDLVREDSFLVSSDVTASYQATWPG
jgi:multiple sugar transport system substrate-binding protein